MEFANCALLSGLLILSLFLQHVLEHGKPHERSAIIKKLTGQIVQMSQQKFASNVIEKCLAFGTPEERETLISEMLGSTEDYEPLQVCSILRASYFLGCFGLLWTWSCTIET